MNLQNLSCSKGCCNYFITPYKNIYVSENYPKENKIKIKKAGSFVFDKSKNKVLLVQSRGHMWGPPKGSIKIDEDPLNCAIREVKEETGLDLLEKNFSGSMIIKCKAQYYFTDMNEQKLYPQEHIKDNDANGIGWFNVECLNDMIKNNKMVINQHCRILIKKIFDKDIVFNEPNEDMDYNNSSKIKRLL